MENLPCSFRAARALEARLREEGEDALYRYGRDYCRAVRERASVYFWAPEARQAVESLRPPGEEYAPWFEQGACELVASCEWEAARGHWGDADGLHEWVVRASDRVELREEFRPTVLYDDKKPVDPGVRRSPYDPARIVRVTTRQIHVYADGELVESAKFVAAVPEFVGLRLDLQPTPTERLLPLMSWALEAMPDRYTGRVWDPGPEVPEVMPPARELPREQVRSVEVSVWGSGPNSWNLRIHVLVYLEDGTVLEGEGAKRPGETRVTQPLPRRLFWISLPEPRR